MANRAPERADRLAEAAFTVLSRRGFEGGSVARIAQAAGVTKGSLYWHFKSKQDVIEAACGHYYRTSLRRMHAEAAAVNDPLQRLERVLRFVVRNCLMNAENRLFTLEILTLSVHDEAIRRGWRQFYETCREFLLGLVEAARLTGQLDTPSPERAVDLILETMEGIKLRALFEPGICSPAVEKQLLSELMDVLRFVGRASAAAR